MGKEEEKKGISVAEYNARTLTDWANELSKMNAGAILVVAFNRETQQYLNISSKKWEPGELIQVLQATIDMIKTQPEHTIKINNEQPS